MCKNILHGRPLNFCQKGRGDILIKCILIDKGTLNGGAQFLRTYTTPLTPSTNVKCNVKQMNRAHTHLYYTSSIIGVISLFALKKFWKILSTGNFNFFLKVKFVILSKSSHNLSISSDMENKRMKFSPNLIAEVKKQAIELLMGTEDRYTVPAKFRGCAQTT